MNIKASNAFFTLSSVILQSISGFTFFIFISSLYEFEGKGTIGMLLLYWNFSIMTIVLGLDSALIRLYNHRNIYNSVYSLSQYVLLVVGLITFALYLLVFGLSSRNATLVVLASATATLYNLRIQDLRLNLDFKRYFIETLRQIITLFITSFFLQKLGVRIEEAYFLALASSYLQLSLREGWKKVISNTRILKRFNFWRLIKHIHTYSLVMQFSRLLFWLIKNFDQIVLLLILGELAYGDYVLMYRIGFLLFSLELAVKSYFTPYALNSLRSSPHDFLTNSYKGLVVSMVIALVLFPLSVFLVVTFFEHYPNLGTAKFSNFVLSFGFLHILSYWPNRISVLRGETRKVFVVHLLLGIYFLLVYLTEPVTTNSLFYMIFVGWVFMFISKLVINREIFKSYQSMLVVLALVIIYLIEFFAINTLVCNL